MHTHTAVVVEFLVSSEGVAIDAGAGRSKATALHYAVQGGHYECVQVMLQYGADVNSLTVTEEVSEIEQTVVVEDMNL